MPYRVASSQKGWQVHHILKPVRLPSGGWRTPSRVYCECQFKDAAEHIAEVLNSELDVKNQQRQELA